MKFRSGLLADLLAPRGTERHTSTSCATVY